MIFCIQKAKKQVMSFGTLWHWIVASACFLVIGTAQAISPVPCGPSSTKSTQSFRVTGSSISLRAAPSSQSERLVNQKATAVLKKTKYMVIDNSTVVSEECSQGAWSRVHVTTPEWLSSTHIGWVPSKVLRGKESDSSGREVFTESDFVWDKNILPYKKIIIAGVNKIHRENSRCADIDPSSAYISDSKGTSKDPVFFVTCGAGSQVFNVYFSKSQVEEGTVLSAPPHIDRSRAISLCEAYAKSKANHPSTGVFSKIMDLAVTEHPDGQTSVFSTFTAKNSFNLKLA
jgi:hypothetical protein